MISVLLVDDHAMMREGLKALLSASAGIRIVAEAGDGRDAIRHAEELSPDVVIMDLSMPGLNGVEAARLLHEKCPGIRIVMLSMHSSSEYVFRAFQAGATGYLLKESAGAEVEAAVRAVYAGRRYLSRKLGALDPAMQTAQGQASPLESLSARERQVLQLVVEGHSSSGIAELVHLSPKSVETYRSRLMKKLGVRDIPALVKFAVEHGLTPPG
ncbi:MAG TPA: response regulator transcription factor [Burkholderiales bacterium]